MCPKIVKKVYLKILLWFILLSFHLIGIYFRFIFLKNDHGLKDLPVTNNTPHLDLYLQMDKYVSKKGKKVCLQILFWFILLSFHSIGIYFRSIFLKNDHGLKELQETNDMPHLDLYLQMDTYVSKNS